MIYIHLIAVVLAVIAAYFSYKAYALFGSKTRKWFIFTLLGFVLLSVVHIAMFSNALLELGISREQLMLIEHTIFFAAMISFILSFHVMINSFKKSFPQLLQKIN